MIVETAQQATTSVWLIVLLVPGVYLGIGLVIGLYIVVTNLAKFHGGGFQWKRMAKHVAMVMLFWPVALAGIIFGVAVLLMLLASPVEAGMSIRSDSGWGEGCMRLAVQLRQLNASAVRVTASASRASDFSFNGDKVCSGTTACSFTWLKRTMKPGENTMAVDVVAADGCGVGVVSYLDLT